MFPGAARDFADVRRRDPWSARISSWQIVTWPFSGHYDFRLCLSLPSHMKLLCKDFTFYAIDLSRVVVADSRLE